MGCHERARGMTQEILNSIILAVAMIKNKDSDKVEGKGWKVYRVGLIIRVDILESEA